MIYSFKYPAKHTFQISPDICIDTDKIICVFPIINTSTRSIFEILTKRKEITISCPCEAAEHLEKERQQLITAWKQSQEE